MHYLFEFRASGALTFTSARAAAVAKLFPSRKSCIIKRASPRGVLFLAAELLKPYRVNNSRCGRGSRAAVDIQRDRATWTVRFAKRRFPRFIRLLDDSARNVSPLSGYNTLKVRLGATAR